MVLSKLKKLSSFKFGNKVNFSIEALQNQISSGLFGVMEKSFQKCLSSSDNSNLEKKDIDSIVAKYAKRNMILAAATAVVPGPLGILGAIPELITNMGNQMSMIYELGCANGKESFLSKDLLLDIPFAAFGGNTNLMKLQSADNLLDSGTSMLKDKAFALGKNMVEKSLKKSVVQFIPVAGPVLMGLWSKATTHKIAKVSGSFFDSTQDYKEHFLPVETEEIKTAIQIAKIKAMANLIECNNEVNEAQIAFIAPIIANANIDEETKELLLQESMKIGSNFTLEYQLLKDFEQDDDVIMELVIMAKRSGQVDKYEKEYIYQVASDLKVEKSFVDQLLV